MADLDEWRYETRRMTEWDRVTTYIELRTAAGLSAGDDEPEDYYR